MPLNTLPSVARRSLRRAVYGGVMHQSEHMDRVELMKVEDTFLIKNIGLVLAPSFELPPDGRWQNIKETVLIKTPEGELTEAEALFSVAHLNIKDPSVSATKRWPILVSLKGINKESVPLGSTVYVKASTKVSITGKHA